MRPIVEYFLVTKRNNVKFLYQKINTYQGKECSILTSFDLVVVTHKPNGSVEKKIIKELKINTLNKNTHTHTHTYI